MNALTIAGFDPSGGAGVLRDCRVFEGLGLGGLAVVTAATAQNTSGFFGSRAVGAGMVAEQLRSVLDDFDVSVAKIGMIPSPAAMRAVARQLRGSGIPIIADPVVKSTTGGTLLPRASLAAYRRHIVPIADVLTPNAYECGVIAGSRGGRIRNAAEKIMGMGAKSVIVTGVQSGKTVSDCVFGACETVLRGKKSGGTSHGGGCSYSASLAAYMARGCGLAEAASLAAAYSRRAVSRAKMSGRGIPVAGAGDMPGAAGELGRAVAEFARMRGAHLLIPECQTNFVYAKKGARTAGDVLGIEGRIVRAGKSVVACGALRYGGSRHVAAAVIEAGKKFPEVRSALNVRYDPALIARLKRAGMAVASYDRAKEPASLKRLPGRSVSWGTRAALRGARRPPDAVFHAGDFGKEPMIVLFGRSPAEALSKAAAALR